MFILKILGIAACIGGWMFAMWMLWYIVVGPKNI